MICRRVNITTVQEVTEGRGPAKLIINEERICTTYSILVLFVVLHGITDLITLLGIFIQQHRMVLPLLILLPFNMIVSIMFFLSVVISYFTVWPNFDGVSFFPLDSYWGEYFQYFVCLVFVQFLLRIYEFRCGRKLYWYLKQRSENFFAPQSTLLKDTPENVFQFWTIFYSQRSVLNK